MLESLIMATHIQTPEEHIYFELSKPFRLAAKHLIVKLNSSQKHFLSVAKYLGYDYPIREASALLFTAEEERPKFKDFKMSNLHPLMLSYCFYISEHYQRQSEQCCEKH